MLIDIVTQTFNRLEFTKQCLEGIRSRTKTPFRLIVVDNGSADGTIEYLQGLRGEGVITHLVLNEENMGLMIPKAQGFAYVESDLFVVTDSDCVPPLLEPDWLSRLAALMGKYRGYAQIAPRGPGTKDSPSDGTIMTVGNIPNIFVMNRRSAIEEIGGYDDKVVMRGQDAAICSRLKAAGWKLGRVVDMWANHLTETCDLYHDNWGYDPAIDKEEHGHARSRLNPLRAVDPITCRPLNTEVSPPPRPDGSAPPAGQVVVREVAPDDGPRRETEIVVPDIAVLIPVKNEADIIEETLTALGQYTDNIFVLDTGSTDGTLDICRASPHVVRCDQSVPKTFNNNVRNTLIGWAKEVLTEDDWLFFFDADEIPTESPVELAKEAAKQRADSITFKAAQFYFTHADLEAYESEDKSLPIQQRRLWYAINWSHPKACRNLKGLKCNTSDFCPSQSSRGNHLKRRLKRKPILKHYQFRSPEQIERRIQERISARKSGCRSFRHYQSDNWQDYVIDESLLHKYGGKWRDGGPSLRKLIQESKKLRSGASVPAEIESEPLVSVIIPTRNRPELLARAVQSAVEQTYANLEILVIDDASDDDMAEVTRKFNDERITYVRRGEASQGRVGRVRNTGLRLATGEYIAYLDDDNTMKPEHVARLVAYLEEHPDVGMVYCDSWVHGHGAGRIRCSREFDRGSLISGNFIDTGEVVHRKECTDLVGGWNEDIPILQDWELWLRISEEFGVVHIKETLSDYYFQKSCITWGKRTYLGAVTNAVKHCHRSELPKEKRADHIRESLVKAGFAP